MTENTGKMRILMIITVSCSRNGITAAALNEIASSDSSFLTIDLVAMNEPEEPVRSIVEGKGGRVYVLPSRNKHPLSYLKQLKKLLKDNSYTGIHVHGNSATMALDLMLAKRCGVPVRVSHGHNTKTSFPILHRIFLPLMLSTANRYAACGRAAGEWLYGGRNFTVLPNAINSEQFSFSKEDRELCRKEYRIPDTARVILHVGSFNAQKNHAFLLDVFFKTAAKDPLAYLILLGIHCKGSGFTGHYNLPVLYFFLKLVDHDLAHVIRRVNIRNGRHILLENNIQFSRSVFFKKAVGHTLLRNTLRCLILSFRLCRHGEQHPRTECCQDRCTLNPSF